ncbi:MAG: OmpH family outer membrane protein [Bacteroidales bacterium]|nr:OmpH family outer membrane protein [Bacteroidales bacterium]
MSEHSEVNFKRNQATILVLNGILLVSIIVLFLLHFSKDDKPATKAGDKTESALANQLARATHSIAFVNSEELLQKYLLVKKLTDQLESERKNKDADFSKRQREFEQEAAYFQESVQKQSISEESAQRIYEQLMMKQEELYKLQDDYSAELAQKEFETNVILLDSVRNYLHRLNKKYNFDYILNYNAAGAILLARDTFDITASVLEGLNSEYLEKYPPKK